MIMEQPLLYRFYRVASQYLGPPLLCSIFAWRHIIRRESKLVSLDVSLRSLLNGPRNGYPSIKWTRPEKTRLIWFHAVSVGESLSAVPLVRHLLNVYPSTYVLMTVNTAAAHAIMQKALPPSRTMLQAVRSLGYSKQRPAFY
mmetsp:Transcript_18181/g.30331  ORF Transcript_18181/g.30331 Transcript_18181/m.30331 type:complete len:142 (+) Transcript_18181:30-455(+)